MLISINDLIKKSIHLYKENLRLFLGYMKILLIPAIILVLSQTAVTVAGGVSLVTKSNFLAFLFFIILIASLLVTLLVTIAFIRVIKKRIDNQTPETIKGELLAARPLLWPSIVASILAGLAVLGGVVLFIIPGIIFSVWFIFVTHAVALDNARGTAALSQSKSIVSGRWFLVLWRLIVPGLAFGIFAAVIQGILQLPLELILQGMQRGTTEFALVLGIENILGAAIRVLVTPLSTGAMTILYLELKHRSSTGGKVVA